jgi:hypothetical protein
MSSAVEHFHVFAKTHRIKLGSFAGNNLLFCIGTPCSNCPVQSVRSGKSCKLTESERNELQKTHPEYFI